MKKRVLFYGDSNTWGFIPASGNRFADNIRWPSVVGAILSDHIVAVEDAISGVIQVSQLNQVSLQGLHLAVLVPPL